MNKVSYSQYTTWANCPESWKLKYVDGHKLEKKVSVFVTIVGLPQD